MSLVTVALVLYAESKEADTASNEDGAKTSTSKKVFIGTLLLLAAPIGLVKGAINDAAAPKYFREAEQHLRSAILQYNRVVAAQ